MPGGVHIYRKTPAVKSQVLTSGMIHHLGASLNEQYIAGLLIYHEDLSLSTMPNNFQNT